MRMLAVWLCVSGLLVAGCGNAAARKDTAGPSSVALSEMPPHVIYKVGTMEDLLPAADDPLWAMWTAGEHERMVSELGKYTLYIEDAVRIADGPAGGWEYTNETAPTVWIAGPGGTFKQVQGDRETPLPVSFRPVMAALSADRRTKECVFQLQWMPSGGQGVGGGTTVPATMSGFRGTSIWKIQAQGPGGMGG
jgi:hypothetical protein